MNHKEKLGYICLGAVIMLVGMSVGSALTPQLVAQHNGVFDEITCRSLNVVYPKGKQGIFLRTTEDGSNLTVEGKHGNRVYLSSYANSSGVSVEGKHGNSVVIRTLGEFTSVILYREVPIKDPLIDKVIRSGITLSTGAEVGRLQIDDSKGNPAFEVNTFPERNELIFSGKPPHKEGIGFYGDSNEAKQTTWTPPKEGNTR